MAIELVTGKAGVPHVDSEDVGAFNAYSLGSGAYIMRGCEVTAKSANIVSISAGEILWEGRHIRVKGSGESLAVDNGQTGYNRRDLITLNYAKDSNGIESASFAVVKGTPTTGTAADPSVKVGSILAGDTSAVIPFARITLSGLSVATPTVLLDSLPSLSSLRDSVSQSLFKTVKYTSPKTDVGSGNVLEYNGTLKNIKGYTPVGIVETNTNHDWSFGLMRATLNGDGTFTCTWMNFNKNTRRGSIGYATVLYIRS